MFGPLDDVGGFAFYSDNFYGPWITTMSSFFIRYLEFSSFFVPITFIISTTYVIFWLGPWEFSFTRYGLSVFLLFIS